MSDPVNGIDPLGLDTWSVGFTGSYSGWGSSFSGGVVVTGNFGAVTAGAFIAGPTLGLATVPALAVTLGISNISNNVGGNFVNSGIDNIINGIQQIKGPIVPNQQCK